MPGQEARQVGLHISRCSQGAHRALSLRVKLLVLQQVALRREDDGRTCQGQLVAAAQTRGPPEGSPAHPEEPPGEEARPGSSPQPQLPESENHQGPGLGLHPFVPCVRFCSLAEEKDTAQLSWIPSLSPAKPGEAGPGLCPHCSPFGPRLPVPPLLPPPCYPYRSKKRHKFPFH